MTTPNKFDFERHKVVAVPYLEDDPEKGQHFHVGLSDLVADIKRYVAEQRGGPGTEIVHQETVREIETLPPEVMGRIEKIERALNELEFPSSDQSDRVMFLAKRLDALESRQTEWSHRLDEVEGRPHISAETVRQLNDGLNEKFKHMIEKLVNAAMGDVRSRLVSVERTVEAPRAITGGEDAAKLSRLAEMLAALGKYVQTIERDLDQRNQDVERLYAEMSEHMVTVNDHISDINSGALLMKTRMYRALKALETEEAA